MAYASVADALALIEAELRVRAKSAHLTAVVVIPPLNPKPIPPTDTQMATEITGRVFDRSHNLGALMAEWQKGIA